jgi:diguanylate cyclase (GGDEF)-like protein
MQAKTSPLQVYWLSPPGIAALVGLVALLAYAVWVLATPYNVDAEKVVSSLLLIVLDALVAAFGLQLAFRRRVDARLRRGWLYISVAFLCNTVAELIWLRYESLLHLNPFPSEADIFYLLFYLFMLLGVLSFPFAPTEQEDRLILWLDLGIVMSASLMVFWYFILAPRVASGQLDLGGLITIAYPIGDLLILGALFVLIQRDFESVTRWMLIYLALGILLTSLADSLFAFYENFGSPYEMPRLNLLWIGSSLTTLVAVGWQLASTRKPLPNELAWLKPPRLLRIVLPYIATGVGLGLLALVTLRTSLVPPIYIRGAAYGAIALTVLVLLRQFVVLRENVLLRERTEELAITDSLTGVFNRRHLNQMLAWEVGRAERFRHPLTLLMMDVDGFKQYNDTYGHPQGDVALKAIAQTLAGQARRIDILARYGGDEFVMILPETNRYGAVAAAHRLQEAVAACAVPGTALRLSVGIGTFRAGLSPEQLVEEADKDLYREKPRQPHPSVRA